MKKKSNIFMRMLYRWFPRKVKNYHEYIALLKKETVMLIVIEGEKERLQSSMFLGSIGTFKYNLVYTSYTPKKRLIYRENYSKRYGSSCGFADAKERATAEIMLLIHAQQVVEKLRSQFPQAQVEYEYVDGKYANHIFWKKIHESAHDLKIAI